MEGFPSLKPLMYEDILQHMEPVMKMMLDLFGPTLGKVLMVKNTGEVAVTNDGSSILSAVLISHPVARTIAQACKDHHHLYGDNAKTCFMMIYSGLLSLTDEKIRPSLCTVLPKHSLHKHKLRSSLTWFRDKILSDLDFRCWVKKCLGKVTKFDDNIGAVDEMACNIVKSNLSGKFSPVAVDTLTRLLMKMIWNTCSNSLMAFRAALFHCIKQFDGLVNEVPGLLLHNSTVVNGLLINKEIPTIFQGAGKTEVHKAVVVSWDDTFQPATDTTISIMKGGEVSSFLKLPVRLLWQWIKHAVKYDVTLVLYQGKALESIRALCEENNVGLIDCLSPEECDFLCTALDLLPLCDITDTINETNLKCINVKEIQLANELYTIISPTPLFKSELTNTSIIVCSPSPGLCSQYKVALYNSLLALRNWIGSAPQSNPTDRGDLILEGVSVSGGGSFHIALYKALSDIKVVQKIVLNVEWNEATTTTYKIAWHIISDMLLIVPKTLHHNSFQVKDKNSRFLKQLNDIHICDHQQITNDNENCSVNSNPVSFAFEYMKNQSIDNVEPLYPQLDLLCNVLDALAQTVKIDSIVSVKRRVRSTIT